MSLTKDEHNTLRQLAKNIKETSRKVMKWEMANIAVIFATVFVLRGVGFGFWVGMVGGPLAGMLAANMSPKEKLREEIEDLGKQMLKLLKKEPDMDQQVLKNFRKDIEGANWRRGFSWPPRLDAVMQDYQEVLMNRMQHQNPVSNQEEDVVVTTRQDLPDTENMRSTVVMVTVKQNQTSAEKMELEQNVKPSSGHKPGV